MQYDQTHIAIRERSFAEIMDLALHVVRRHPIGLLVAMLVGVAPWVALNYVLTVDLVSRNEIYTDPSAYLTLLGALVVVETPFATAWITLFLGQVTFSRQVDVRRMVLDFLGSLPQLVLLQGVLRALMLPLVVTLLLPYANWPYLSELILLERNPLLGRKGRLTTLRRSRNLHRRSSGELFARWLASFAMGVVLLGALLAGGYMLVGELSAWWPDEVAVYRWMVPPALWIVVSFFAVVRFLSYLDLRIRREGWEVELLMRAEALRLSRAWA